MAALQRVAERAQETADRLVVRVETSGARRALPVALEAALVRVAQSALANVVQHSGARNAVVTLTYLDDEVILDVVDDGRGFAPDRHAPAPAASGWPRCGPASRRSAAR